MLKIGILEGDDIGLEVVPEAVKVMKAAAGKVGLDIDGREVQISSPDKVFFPRLYTLGKWLSNQQRMDMSRSVLAASGSSNKLPRRLYYIYIEMLQAIADISEAEFDIWSMPTAAATVVSYSLYTLSEDTISKFGSDRLKWTIPFVLFGLFRYLYLVHVRKQGDQPEKVLLTDLPLLLNVLLYGGVVVMVLYFDI